MTLAGKTVLITGGGTGIGAATARVFATRGARPVLFGPDREPLEKVAAETDGLAIVGDAADGQSVRAALQKIRRHFGGVQILVTCAGGGGMGTLLDNSDDDWAAALRLNLTTASVTARECLPDLIEARGAIVIVSSQAGIEAAPGAVGYTTAKHALLGLARSLACDFGPVGVRVNAVCPGFTRTAIADRVMDGLAARDGVTREEAYARATASAPLRRPAEPTEIGNIVAFLASDDASIMTGAVVIADAGATAVTAI